ncbi:unnamed protein product [Rhizopus stolonifer]
MNFKQVFEQNIHEPWRTHYANLNRLDSPHRIESEVQAELTKVLRFINKKQREIDSRIAYENRSRARAELDEVLLDLNELSRYTRLNCLALEPFGADIQQLDTQRFDLALVKIGRLLGSPKKIKSTFWVNPDQLTELRANLLFYLPPSNPESISCTYFDTPSLDHYKTCLQQIDAKPIKEPQAGLEPILQVKHTRVIFGADVILDTQLEFTRPDTQEKMVFPYALLSIHDPPVWLMELVQQSKWICEVPRFSKYIQGASYFWKSPLTPWWLDHATLFERTKEVGYLNYQLLYRTDRHTQCHVPLPTYIPSSPMTSLISSTIVPDSAFLETVVSVASEEKPQPPKKKPGVIEPKVFLANERTFIHWLHFSSTLLNVAVTLLNFGDGVNRTVGIVFFAIAFIFATYSFGFFRWRVYRILNKPHLRFDDMFGPVFLCVLLTGSLVLNFVLRFNTPTQGNTYLGVNSTDNSL